MHVTRVLAPNPSLLTGPGTNTYVLDSDGDALVIDPGPVIESHLTAIEDALDGLAAVGVAVTHTHPDHAPAANPLAARLGVPAYGFGPGPGFRPVLTLGEGDDLPVGSATVRVLHTPGHAEDHLCFLVDDVLFTGDHLMGGSTVMIEDLAAYLDSLRRLQAIELRRLNPGHGPEVDDPQALIAYYISHRLEREQQVLDALAAGAATLGDVIAAVYEDVDPALHPVAALSAAAHLRKLADDGAVEFAGAAEWSAPVHLTEEAT